MMWTMKLYYRKIRIPIENGNILLILCLGIDYLLHFNRKVLIFVGSVVFPFGDFLLSVMSNPFHIYLMQQTDVL